MLSRLCRLGSVVLVCATLSMGCAGLQVKRGVDGNTLYSSARPRLNVETAAGYRLIKEQKDADSQFFANSDGSTNIEKEVYRFWNTEKRREIQVQFHRIGRQNAYWNPIDFSDAKHLIEAGEESLNGDVYKYAVYPIVDGNGCFLVKVIGRRIGAQSDTKMLLYFVEKVAGKNAFPKWIHKERFSPAQKERLRNFMEAFHRDVKIMDYADPSA